MKPNKIIAISLALCALFALMSCQKQPKYDRSMSAEELAADVAKALPDSVFLPAAEGYLEEYFPIPEGVSDYRILFAGDGNNLDEVGIWRTDGSSAEQLRARIEGYLSESYEQNRSFYDSYIPTQTPKLRDAEVRIYGSYVAYAILSDADRKTFFEILEKDLLQEKAP